MNLKMSSREWLQFCIDLNNNPQPLLHHLRIRHIRLSTQRSQSFQFRRYRNMAWESRKCLRSSVVQSSSYYFQIIILHGTIKCIPFFIWSRNKCCHLKYRLEWFSVITYLPEQWVGRAIKLISLYFYQHPKHQRHLHKQSICDAGNETKYSSILYIANSTQFRYEWSNGTVRSRLYLWICIRMMTKIIYTFYIMPNIIWSIWFKIDNQGKMAYASVI